MFEEPLSISSSCLSKEKPPYNYATLGCCEFLYTSSKRTLNPLLVD